MCGIRWNTATWGGLLLGRVILRDCEVCCVFRLSGPREGGEGGMGTPNEDCCWFYGLMESVVQ